MKFSLIAIAFVAGYTLSAPVGGNVSAPVEEDVSGPWQAVCPDKWEKYFDTCYEADPKKGRECFQEYGKGLRSCVETVNSKKGKGPGAKNSP
ncbi:hypothetical protein MGU_09023 [Metarhizium guizhouense ARSEF 977]|uniref:Uncharacterized protein n=1 Tax=Metarhizium guizhouense (strain ARSEF 977) TaxID=1276136 RepID=A0A0B4GVK5_METGA|nr:hypothetical protein MGU_09023 [Metarhizium guizhouense ARSEF 977]